MTQIDNPNISATTSTSVTTSWMGWLVWGLACLFYFYECLLQVSPSVMSNELMRDFSVTSHTLGILSGIYFYSYAAMQLPAGLFIDYFGPRRLLSLASLVCGISTFAFGFTHSFGAACLARLMIGFGSAFACVGCMKFAANWFCPKRFPIMMGLMVTMGMLGAIGGEAPLALLIEHFEWRHSMMILGVIGVILAFLIRVFTRDTPRQGPINAVTREVEAPFSASLGIVLKDKRFWTIALYGGLMYLSTPVFCGLWGVPFLMDKFLITKTSAANYVSLVFIGWAVAGPFWGMFSNYIACRKTPLYIANIGALICSLGFLYTSITPIMFLFLFGVFSSAFLPAFTIAKELCETRYVATGLGFMNMMNMLGIALVQPLVGFILDALWRGDIQHHVRVYPLQAYYIALGALPIAIIISLLLLPFVKETYGKHV